LKWRISRIFLWKISRHSLTLLTIRMKLKL